MESHEAGLLSSQRVSDWSETKRLEVKKEQEYRFEVCDSEKVIICLVNGSAEVFGSQLDKNQEYTFYEGAKVAIFTWTGCTLSIEGSVKAKLAKETPMTFYRNIHQWLEEFRTLASGSNKKGPSVMICGPPDVGKSTLCRLLLNYAARDSRTPLFADVDIAQGAIGIPGVLGLIVVQVPAIANGGFSQKSPFMFNLGTVNQEDNMGLYETLINRLAVAAEVKSDQDAKVRSSGLIINTCGWVSGETFTALVDTARAFKVDLIVVLEQEQLLRDLAKELPNSVRLVLAPKSSGVVTRDKEYKHRVRDSRTREYFYGIAPKDVPRNTRIPPYRFEVPCNEMKIFRIASPSESNLDTPLGMKADRGKTRLVAVDPETVDDNRILSLSFCSKDDGLVEANVQGFICINTDNRRSVFSVLSLQPAPLPTGCIFLLSEILYMD
ncbi:Protein CLP1 -like protein [Halotydeus destructor]|nr:Protein CLP1 -like protein [Halotydeus destructor]